MPLEISAPDECKLLIRLRQELSARRIISSLAAGLIFLVPGGIFFFIGQRQQGVVPLLIGAALLALWTWIYLSWLLSILFPQCIEADRRIGFLTVRTKSWRIIARRIPVDSVRSVRIIRYQFFPEALQILPREGEPITVPNHAALTTADWNEAIRALASFLEVEIGDVFQVPGPRWARKLEEKAKLRDEIQSFELPVIIETGSSAQRKVAKILLVTGLVGVAWQLWRIFSRRSWDLALVIIPFLTTGFAWKLGKIRRVEIDGSWVFFREKGWLREKRWQEALNRYEGIWCEERSSDDGNYYSARLKHLKDAKMNIDLFPFPLSSREIFGKKVLGYARILGLEPLNFRCENAPSQELKSRL